MRLALAFCHLSSCTADPAYRYKMPKVTVKIEGKGNGIKTIITNMSQIAAALRRDPALPTKVRARAHVCGAARTYSPRPFVRSCFPIARAVLWM